MMNKRKNSAKKESIGHLEPTLEKTPIDLTITLENDIWNIINLDYDAYKKMTRTEISLDKYMSLKLSAPYVLAQVKLQEEKKFREAENK